MFKCWYQTYIQIFYPEIENIWSLKHPDSIWGAGPRRGLKNLKWQVLTERLQWLECPNAKLSFASLLKADCELCFFFMNDWWTANWISLWDKCSLNLILVHSTKILFIMANCSYLIGKQNPKTFQICHTNFFLSLIRPLIMYSHMKLIFSCSFNILLPLFLQDLDVLILIYSLGTLELMFVATWGNVYSREWYTILCI